MPSTKASVNSTKNTLVKPMLRKIYDTHKKWLGGDHKAQNPKRAEKDNKIAKVVVHAKSAQRQYENVEHTRKSKETDSNLFMDSSVESNVTVVEVSYDGKKTSEDSNKLRIVINNFDKILDEYGAHKKKETRIPKLQKSKTCSIIESKCVLKKSNSQPLNKNDIGSGESALQHKTKSMGHIDQDLGKLSEVRKPQFERKGEIISASTPKVKEVIKMMDNIAKSSAIEKDKPVAAKPPLSKAVSSYDLSSRRSLTVSRIPVKAPLRKTYPSTPSGLDKLDCAKRSTKTFSLDARSTLGNGDIKNAAFSKSVQNLSKKVPKKEVRDYESPSMKISGKFAKSIQNLSGSVSVPVSKKSEAAKVVGKSMQNLSVAAKKPPVAKQSKDVHKSNLVAVAKQVGRSTGSVADECLLKSECKMENLVAKTKEVKVAKPKVLVETQVVKTAIEKFETTCDTQKKRYETYKKEKPALDPNTFAAKKLECEPKFVQTVARSDTYKKTDAVKQMKQRAAQIGEKEGDIFNDREIEHEFVRNEQKNVNARNKINEIISNFESKAVVARIESELSAFGYSKVKEYNSDDNSDDSGNISNEHELDCDEGDASTPVTSSRSSTSEESLLVSDDSLENKRKQSVVVDKEEKQQEVTIFIDSNTIFFGNFLAERRSTIDVLG